MRSEFKFARQRLAGESGDDIELCRANLTARLERCDINCDACGAHCTSKTVRDIVGVAKCSVALPILGMLQAQHSSDLGLVRKHHTQTIWCALHPRTAPHIHVYKLQTRIESRILSTPQDIGFRWGAKRYDMRPANPSNSWEEKYRILIQNDIDAPYAPRNCKLSTQTTTPHKSQIRCR
jgi:hypothetical protein